MEIILEKGLFIAFIGQDGCGKSTIIQDIEENFKQKISLKKFYMGSGDGYTSIIKRLLIRTTEIDNPHPLIVIAKEILLLLFYMEIAKNYFNIIKESRIVSLRGGLVIFDRYPQIQFEGIYDGPKIRSRMADCNSILVKIFLPLCAVMEEKWINAAIKTTPDIVFKLVLPVKESLKRKPNHDIDKLNIKHIITEQLLFNTSEIISIDATQQYSDVLLEVENHLSRLLIA